MGQVEPDDLGLKPSPQGEEGPPSLEYIQAKDLFPPKELVKEEENLQVRRSWGPRVGGALCSVKNTFPSLPSNNISKGSSTGALASCFRVSRGRGICVCALWSLWPQGRKGSFPVRLLPGAATVERTLLFFLGPTFPVGIPQVKVGEGDGGVTYFWTEGPSAPRQVPFAVLQGEGVEFLGRAADALIAISNYRLHIKFKDSVINVSSRLVLPHPRQNPCLVHKCECSSAGLDHVSKKLGCPSFQ